MMQKSRSIIVDFLVVFLFYQQVLSMEFAGNSSLPTDPTISTFDYIKFFLPPAVVLIGVLTIGIKKSCDMCKKAEHPKPNQPTLNRGLDYHSINPELK